MVTTKTAVTDAPLASETIKEIQSQDSNKISETKQEDLNKTITDDVKLPQDNTNVDDNTTKVKSITTA